jgi:PD-(D/E)XK nuclease superfamily
MPRKRSPIDRSVALRVAVAFHARNLPSSLSANARWSEAGIYRVARALRGQLTGAVARLAPFARETSDQIPALRSLKDYATLVGPPWLCHPLRYSPRVHGYRVHEPHLTKTLAEFLRPTEPKPGSHDRAHAFLAALFQAAGMRSASPCRPQMRELAVTAEQPIGRSAKSKRIDLVFAWTEGEGRRFVAIEVKFRHVAMRGTLPAYRQYVQTLAGSDRFDLFLLTLRPDVLARRNNGWVQVGWLNLLRHWEQHLFDNGDTDNDFARFRAELWQQVGGRAHA